MPATVLHACVPPANLPVTDRAGATVRSLLWIRNLRHREVQSLTCGHTTRRGELGYESRWPGS